MHQPNNPDFLPVQAPNTQFAESISIHESMADNGENSAASGRSDSAADRKRKFAAPKVHGNNSRAKKRDVGRSEYK